MNDEVYFACGSLNGGHDVVREEHEFVWFIHLLCDLHMGLGRKQGIDNHVLNGLRYYHIRTYQ